MKRLLNLLPLLFLLILFSCEKDSSTLKESNKQDPNIEILKQMGFDISNLKEFEECYLVEGDIKILKKELAQYIQKGKKQAHVGTTYWISSSNRDIKVYLNQSTFNSLDVSQELTAVVNAYNAIYSSLNFEVVTSSSNADLTISQGTGSYSGDCAEASFPLNGKVGSSIIIDESVLVTYNLTSHNQVVYLIAHEIGHCIGLRHTNWDTSEWPGSEPQNATHPNNPSLVISAVTVPGTDNSDANSIFNKAQCGRTWDSGFTTNDIKAIQYMYPKPQIPTEKATATGDTYMSSSESTVTWRYTGNVSNVSSYSWWYSKEGGSGAPYVIGTGSSATFQAVSDSFYSDTSTRTSYFKIYLKVYTTDGKTYTSPTYTVMKKGKWKLTEGFSPDGPLPF